MLTSAAGAEASDCTSAPWRSPPTLFAMAIANLFSLSMWGGTATPSVTAAPIHCAVLGAGDPHPAAAPVFASCWRATSPWGSAWRSAPRLRLAAGEATGAAAAAPSAWSSPPVRPPEGEGPLSAWRRGMMMMCAVPVALGTFRFARRAFWASDAAARRDPLEFDAPRLSPAAHLAPVLILSAPGTTTTYRPSSNGRGFGIQHVWTIEHPQAGPRPPVGDQGQPPLLTRRFFTEIECVAAGGEPRAVGHGPG